MARINYVKKAQQRYKMVPVIDPATGEQKQVATTRVNKHGQPVMLSITEPDKSQPTPNDECESCRAEILPGQPYRWVQPKNRGRRTRCGDCPTWQPWDLSNALWARIAKIQDDFDISECRTPDEVQEQLGRMAEEIRGLAEEKRESQSNIEEGFGHPTSQSDELGETADSLDDWAQEIEDTEIPELPEPVECEDGWHDHDPTEVEEDAVCEECGGAVDERLTPDEPTDEQIDEWVSEVEDACSITDESPV